jgi:adenosylcobinamide-GDP ribazoletransferase
MRPERPMAATPTEAGDEAVHADGGRTGPRHGGDERVGRGPNPWDPLLAVEFLTVVRLRRWRPVDPAALARAQVFYPLVGLGLGLVLVGLDRALGALLPSAPRSALTVAALVVLTRGLHLDGLADTFDGLLGGRDRARRLEILRDPRVGTFGVAAVALVLLLKWSAVLSLDASGRGAGLVLAPVLGRCAMVVLAAAVPYARPQGLGAGYHEAARGAPLLASLAAGPVVALLVYGPAGLALVVTAALVALAMAWWARAALGGTTGDVYGATCELAETAVLLGAAAGQVHGWLAPWVVRP